MNTTNREEIRDIHRETTLARAAIARELARNLPWELVDRVAEAKRKLDEAQREYRRSVEQATEEFMRSLSA